MAALYRERLPGRRRADADDSVCDEVPSASKGKFKNEIRRPAGRRPRLGLGCLLHRLGRARHGPAGAERCDSPAPKRDGTMERIRPYQNIPRSDGLRPESHASHSRGRTLPALHAYVSGGVAHHAAVKGAEVASWCWSIPPTRRKPRTTAFFLRRQVFRLRQKCLRKFIRWWICIR